MKGNLTTTVIPRVDESKSSPRTNRRLDRTWNNVFELSPSGKEGSGCEIFGCSRQGRSNWLRLSSGLGRFRAVQFPIVLRGPSSFAALRFVSLSDLEALVLFVQVFVSLVIRVSNLTGLGFPMRLGGRLGPVLRPPECRQLLSRSGQGTRKG